MSNDIVYERADITVDIIVIRLIESSHECLLIKRRNDPYKDMWALPGGYLDVDKKETLEQAARRELMEETGLVVDRLLQLNIYDDPDRDPRGRTITVAYYCFVDYDVDVVAGDDAKVCGWFPLVDLPPMAFDHEKIITDVCV